MRVDCRKWLLPMATKNHPFFGANLLPDIILSHQCLLLNLLNRIFGSFSRLAVFRGCHPRSQLTKR